MVGGKLGRYVRDTPDGAFRFDTGPSLLTLPQVFADLFADRADLDEYSTWCRWTRSSGTSSRTAPVLDSCADPAIFAARIGAAFGAAAAADWQRLWRRAGRVWDASWRHVLRRPVDSPPALARLAWRLRRPGRDRAGPDAARAGPPVPARPAAADAAGPVRHLHRRRSAPGARPRWSRSRTPSWRSAAGTCAAGWARSADALLARCLDLGVAGARPAPRSTGIDAAGGRVSGVRLAGAAAPVPADVVVANVDALTVYRDLLPDPRRLARLADRSLGRLRAAARRPRPHARAGPPHRVLPAPTTTPSSTRSSAPGAGRPARPAADPTVFVTVRRRPGGAPGRARGLVRAGQRRPARHRPSRGGLAPAGAGRRVRRPGPGRAGRARLDVRDRVLFREVRTPADLAGPTAAPGGAIYGTAGRRPAPPARTAARSHGLFLVGGSTHPGGGLPMVTLSAQIVADQIGPA